MNKAIDENNTIYTEVDTNAIKTGVVSNEQPFDITQRRASIGYVSGPKWDSCLPSVDSDSLGHRIPLISHKGIIILKDIINASPSVLHA